LDTWQGIRHVGRTAGKRRRRDPPMLMNRIETAVINSAPRRGLQHFY
jgi:hypothetical protein